MELRAQFPQGMQEEETAALMRSEMGQELDWELSQKPLVLYYGKKLGYNLTMS